MAEQTETVEEVKNCAECKKSISRARRYYRNGAYYCNKNCYKKKVTGAATEASGDKSESASKKEDKSESKGEDKNQGKEEVKKDNNQEAKDSKE